MNNTSLYLSILIAFSASIAIFSKWNNIKQLFYFSKPFTTILIIFLAVISSNYRFNAGNWLIVSALFFCLIGDIFLMYESGFIYGLVFFLVGHLFLIAFFLAKSKTVNFYPLPALTVIGAGLFSLLKDKLGRMKLPVLFYIVTISIMSWLGISLYLTHQNLAGTLIAVGVVLFTFSDTNIALNKFYKAYRLSNFLILSTYYAAIYLLALSLKYL